MKKVLMLLMAVTFIMALAACGSSEKAADNKGADAGAATGQQVKLVASNYEFDQKEYKVKKGEPVTITLENKQGIHGVSIKDLSVNLDNNKKTVTITPDKVGSFPIICSIPCGTGHATMKTLLIVE
ncbi:nitrous-oxide reductase [compost metagenome]